MWNVNQFVWELENEVKELTTFCTTNTRYRRSSATTLSTSIRSDSLKNGRFIYLFILSSNKLINCYEGPGPTYSSSKYIFLKLILVHFHFISKLLFKQNYLQWTTTGELQKESSISLRTACTNVIKSRGFFGQPKSGQSIYWKCFTCRKMPSFQCKQNKLVKNR